MGFNCADMGLTHEGCQNDTTCAKEACNKLYITLDELNDLQEELAKYEQDMARDPHNWNNWMALSQYGYLLLQFERNKEALTACERVTELKPDYYWAWYNQSTVLERLRRYKEALAACERAIEIRFYEDLGWHKRSILLMILGQGEEAFAAYKRATELRQSLKRKIVFEVVSRLPNQFQYADIERAYPEVSRSTICRALADLRSLGQVRRIQQGRNAIWEKIQIET
ncbi:hypothetical protein DSM107010_54060 [Chroococcidiopsis cubana SAG 39.79]|uniref:Tetratricopeptide repeat protein n=2 Tax=Chroococcidiopsis TaxID=54298 RepID=A0AB37UCL3_9CYAN|nr:hypothetical protein C7B79_18080 [Chroococcidiopsis cubana CCALA 043]RUT05876.1 hypothetical protein DSM107010_54060 [Chroococcidiopsis cubana SAG 39.79]